MTILEVPPLPIEGKLLPLGLRARQSLPPPGRSLNSPHQVSQPLLQLFAARDQVSPSEPAWIFFPPRDCLVLVGSFLVKTSR